MNARRIMLAAVLVLCVCAAALADIIYLNTGGKVTGKIIERRTDEIVVSTPRGLIAIIPVKDIESIEEGSVEELYKQQLGELKDSDADGHYKLGLWCKDVGLAKEAKQEFEKVIALAPDHEEARWALGYQQVGGKWVTEDELMSSKGFIKHEGKWITKEDHEKIQKGFVNFNGEWVSKEDYEKLRKGLRKAGEKWLTEDEYYKAKGYVKHEGKWVTKDYLEKLKQEAAPAAEEKKEKKPFKRFSGGRGGQAGSFTEKIKINGKEREYVLKVPGWAAGGKAPLVVLLHGTNSRPSYMLTYWSPVAGNHAILAAPWALGGKWLEGEEASKDDPQFVMEMIEQIKKRYNIANEHVYLAGHSRGGFFTFTLGVQHGDLFAGCGLLAGGYSGYVNASEQKAPFYIYIVEKDPSVSVSSARQAKEVLEKNGHEVKYHEVPGGKGTAMDHELTRACCQECWDFFKKHKLKHD